MLTGRRSGRRLVVTNERGEEIAELASTYLLPEARLMAAGPDLRDLALALLENHQRMEPHHHDLCRLCQRAERALTEAGLSPDEQRDRLEAIREQEVALGQAALDALHGGHCR